MFRYCLTFLVFVSCRVPLDQTVRLVSLELLVIP